MFNVVLILQKTSLCYMTAFKYKMWFYALHSLPALSILYNITGTFHEVHRFFFCRYCVIHSAQLELSPRKAWRCRLYLGWQNSRKRRVEYLHNIRLVINILRCAIVQRKARVTEYIRLPHQNITYKIVVHIFRCLSIYLKNISNTMPNLREKNMLRRRYIPLTSDRFRKSPSHDECTIIIRLIIII